MLNHFKLKSPQKGDFSLDLLLIFLIKTFPRTTLGNSMDQFARIGERFKTKECPLC